MGSDAKKVLVEALELLREARAEIVGQLLRSLDDEEDRLAEQDRAELHASITRSEEQFAAGAGISAEMALDQLRKQ